MTLGEILSTARKTKGLTQKELAQRIGAMHTSISNWENDKNKPAGEVLLLLCKVLDIDSDELLKVNEPNEIAVNSLVKEKELRYKPFTSWEQVPLILDVGAMAHLLNSTVDTVTRHCKAGMYPAFMVDDKWYVSKDALREWMNNGGSK